MQVRHPQALDGVVGDCPDSVHVGGERRDCADGSAFEASEARAKALAERYGVDVASITVGNETAPDPADGDEDGETCGYYDEEKMDAPCKRDAGWGRDTNTGRCKDHVDA